MNDYVAEFEALIKAATTLVGDEIDMGKIEIVDRGRPHIPQALKPASLGVYTFNYNGRFLKIGRVGTASNARFQYQHYKPGSAKSTLADSLLADPEMVTIGISRENVGQWIKDNCQRIDIFLDEDLGFIASEFIEAILHYRYKPPYEGIARKH